uniref:TAF1C beta-propeller domain-containing protein n=1 Tax=Xiphophorus couchianus TaxID=32473 RepID=A0A3B5L9D7_9TELE
MQFSEAATGGALAFVPFSQGEVLVASESGAANLWTVGRGMQEVRTEESNLYFNAKSSWRWCEFSAHPRVMLYADRTGVELTDFRSNPCHTLFRISSTSDCQSGERLLLVRFLGDVHPFHHLLTTQHSAYIMDERFPGVPMLKWDHMMEAPPLFCHVAPGSASGTTKVLLGSQSSQEITLLQYSGELAGGSSRLCHGSPQVLLRPRDSLALLPVQIPHRQQTAAHRLASPAAGHHHFLCDSRPDVSPENIRLHGDHDCPPADGGGGRLLPDPGAGRRKTRSAGDRTTRDRSARDRSAGDRSSLSAAGR